MKRIILLFVFLFISVTTLLSQDSLESALQFYPLQTGNYREYARWISHPPYNDSIHLEYFSIEVLGDSILPNGIKYKSLKYSYMSDGSFRYGYERIDSTTANVYRYEGGFPVLKERLIDSLMSNLSDSSYSHRDFPTPNAFTFCTNIYDDEVLTFPTRIKVFYDDGFSVGLEYRLAKNIGYIGDLRVDIDKWGTDLIYARVGQIEIGNSITSVQMGSDFSSKFKLLTPYPNPFNSSTTISFYSPISQFIKIVIFDIQGRRVEELYSGFCNAGLNKVKFNNRSLSSGVFPIKLVTRKQVFTDKLIYIK